MINELLQAIVSGLLVGLTYALLSVGFSLTWGAVGVINISHAVFSVFAAYIGYFMVTSLGLNPLISLFIIIPLFYLIGVTINGTVFKALTKRSRNLAFASMVLTFGIAVAIENAMMWGFTANPRVLTTSFSDFSFNIGPVYLLGSQMMSGILSVICLFLIYLYLYHTSTGKSVRAYEQDREGAALSGVNTNKVTSITVGIALASAGVAGIALSLIFPFEPTIHMDWLVMIFLIVILGGVGSILGTFIGGIVVGMISTVIGVWLPYTLVNLVMFVILILILIIRTKET